jgi:hypothetical protein
MDLKNVKICPEAHKRLRVCAAYLGIQISECATAAILDYVARQEAIRQEQAGLVFRDPEADRTQAG